MQAAPLPPCSAPPSSRSGRTLHVWFLPRPPSPASPHRSDPCPHTRDRIIAAIDAGDTVGPRATGILASRLPTSSASPSPRRRRCAACPESLAPRLPAYRHSPLYRCLRSLSPSASGSTPLSMPAQRWSSPHALPLHVSTCPRRLHLLE